MSNKRWSKVHPNGCPKVGPAAEKRAQQQKWVQQKRAQQQKWTKRCSEGSPNLGPKGVGGPTRT